MKRFLLILILQNFTSAIFSQSFTVDDLVKVASLPIKNIDHFINKNGYELVSSKSEHEILEASYSIKIKKNKTYDGPKRIIDIQLSDELKYFNLTTSSLTEYLNGRRFLIKSGFFYDTEKDVSKDTAILFQKGNISIKSTQGEDNGVPQYNFKLTERKIPSTVKYAEDLLQFDSNEFLASFFGDQNIKKDMYYFSEKELKKCSVLFSGTRYQVVFVWGDEKNLKELLYILVPHSLPTAGAEKKNPVTGNNEWQFRNGIYPGMDLKELLKLNEMDFNIYGNASELAFMVKPAKNGKIDFKKTAVVLNCENCDDLKIFNQQEVSALDIAKKNLPMYVNDVIIYPSHH